MRRVIPLLVALSGCSHDVERDAIAAEPTTVQAPLRGAPHGGSIREVAVTESGDAAISVDQQGGIRVWPALDGSREAVPVIAPAPVEVAIARHGDELVAGLIDEAGSAQVLRVGGMAGSAGEARSRARCGSSRSSRWAMAWSSGARTNRSSGSTAVARCARGSSQRRENGSHRWRCAAIAVIAGAEGTSNRVRWIERDFTWGARVTLPSQVWPESVALSPSHKRLAGAEGTSRQLGAWHARHS